MANTEDKILDSAEGLIQSRGYSAISYQDISEQVGIRKASIHYYFPAKGDLVEAVVRRYRKTLQSIMEQSFASRADDALGMLDDYFAVYLSFENEPEKICLCGALSGEYPVLPDNAKQAVDEFFMDHETWLTRVIEIGVAKQQFLIKGEAHEVASWMLATLQGALMLGRATNAPQKNNQIQHLLRQSLIAA